MLLVEVLMTAERNRLHYYQCLVLAISRKSSVSFVYVSVLLYMNVLFRSKLLDRARTPIISRMIR